MSRVRSCRRCSLIGRPAGQALRRVRTGCRGRLRRGCCGSSSRGTSSSSSCSALSARAAMRVACWMVSVSRPAKSVSDSVIPAFASPARTASASMSPSAALARSSGGQIGRDVAVDDHAADRQPQFPQFLDRFERLLDRQRLQQGDEVDGGEVGMQHLDHAFGLRVHRAALGEVRHRLGDVQEPRDAARRRGVDHDGVVGRLLALLGAGHDLA